MTISEAYNTQIENEVKAEIKKLKQQNRHNKQRIQELKFKLTAPERAPTEQEKVRVLREATQLALKSAENWIHDQLDGTSSLESALAELQPVRNALQATAPEQDGGGKPVAWEYYYKTKGCSAKNAHDPDCICWHKEGTGPYDNERHDSTSSPVIWRLLTSPHQQQVVEP